MAYHDNLTAKQKHRLENWQKTAPTNFTQHHVDLISVAIHLATRYGAGSRNAKDESSQISNKIYQLALAALDSEDPNRVPLLKDWFAWLDREMSHEGSPPDKVKLPMIFIVKMMEEQIKYANSISHNPSNILSGKKGVDARVIVRGTNNHYDVASGSELNRTFGATVEDIPKSGTPLFAAVQLATSGETLKIGGDYSERVGPQIGRSESPDRVETPPTKERVAGRKSHSDASPKTLTGTTIPAPTAGYRTHVSPRSAPSSKHGGSKE